MKRFKSLSYIVIAVFWTAIAAIAAPKAGAHSAYSSEGTLFTTLLFTDTCSAVSVANAGPDQSVCSSSATLSGNVPVVGTGTWSVVSGTATVTSPNDPSSDVTGLSLGDNMFEWMISYGTCPTTRDTVTITRSEPPTAANAGPDQTVCSSAATLAGNTPAVGTGTWSTVSGSGVVTNPGDPASGVTGLSIGENLFEWMISNGICPTTRDTVSIIRDAPPTAANAGPDQTLCSSTATLAGNTPAIGTGTWSVIVGSATVTSPNDPASGVTGLVTGTNTFEWTISNGSCPASRDTMTITRDPSPTAADAGPDQTVCASTATLAGNTPIVGTGSWTVLGGSAVVTVPSDPTSGVTGLTVGANTFEWMIANGICSTTRDTVTITRNAPPSTANAGPDQTVCSSTATLAGNTPAVGTGTWSTVSGSGVVTFPGDATSGVTGLSIGENLFEWMISNGVCPTTRDTVSITREAPPTVANAGADFGVCTSTATLAGNTPTVGTGTWAVLSGGATVTTPSSPTSGVTGLSLGANMFEWMISNGICPTSRDTVTVTRDDLPTPASAGPDQNVCDSVATLAGNTPAVGTGTWTVIAGTATVTSPSDPASAVTGLIVGVNTFVWTISSTGCGSSSDTVSILRDPSPSTANAGPDQNVCDSVATLAGNTPTVGTGAWTVITGSAAVTVPSNPTSGVAGLSVGANTFVWSISNGSCPPSRDTVIITRNAIPTTANAGPDQNVCDSAATLAGNTPTSGTGLWTVISGPATVTSPANPASGVTGLALGSNTFVWTISNGVCTPSRDTVVIFRNTPPTTANAGPDQALCSTTTALAGNTPTVGTGAWSVAAGSATVTTPGSPTSAVTGLSYGANKFVWSISNGVCAPSQDTVTVMRDQPPTTANAGFDQTSCSSSATLSGNVPSIGTGLWTVIAGGAAVTATSNPLSPVTGLSVGVNAFVWTISNGTCSSSRDTVTITRSPAITFSTTKSDVQCNGGSDGSITVTAAGGIGTLRYSRDNGINFQASNTFNNLLPATYKIVVTDSAGCISGSQSVIISQPTAISIGPATLLDAAVMTPYSQSFAGTGGTPPYSFTATGAVPPGLSLSLSGELSGIPTTAGIYVFTVHDTDSHYCGASKGYTLVVSKKPTKSLLTQSVNLTLVGDSVTFRDSVAGSVPDGGTIQFKDGNSTIGGAIPIDSTGVATLIYSDLTVGHHTITAFYSGTVNYDSSTSNGVSHVVARPDSTEYRAATYEDWATAADAQGKLRSVRRVPDKVDFTLNITSPIAASAFTLSFNMPSSGVITRWTTKTDTLVPVTPWDNVTSVTFVGAIDSNITLQLNGRGNKGKYITVTVRWENLSGHTLVAYKSPQRFVLNQPRLPMPDLHNVGEEILSNDTRHPSLVLPNGLLVGVPLGTKKAGSVLMKKYRDVQKSLITQTRSGNVLHTQGPRCFSVGLGDNVNITFRQQRYLPPNKFNDKLFGELVALKLNVAASVMNKFPNGLGELTYNDASDPENIFNNLIVNDIIKKADTVLTCLSTDIRNHQLTIDEVYQCLRRIDSALSGPIDTISFAQKTALTGAVKLIDVPFLHKTEGIIPLSIVSPVYHDPLPSGFELQQNYPNPFNPTTTIQFLLAEPSTVSLKIYNMLGQEVASLIDAQVMDDGIQEVDFNASKLASGVYFYRIVVRSLDTQADGSGGRYFAQTKRMLLLK